VSSEAATHGFAKSQQTAVARANAYHVLAQAFRDPEEWEPTLPATLREGLAHFGPALRARAAHAADAWEAALREREPAAVAHARLFLGPFELEAPPYASLYLDPERRLMGRVGQEVAHAYAEAGLGPGPGPREAPDHVTCELEFMYFLAFREATTGEPAWAERQGRFWRSHLGGWLPELARRIAEARAHPFYDALARLLEAFAAHESAALRPSSSSPSHGFGSGVDRKNG
jgi:TorA maturation chaperone TorD